MLFWGIFALFMICGLVYSLRMQKKIKARLESEAKDTTPQNDD